MIKGKLINNNSKTLTIVFQSAGRISSELFDRIYKKENVKEEVENAHKKYTWFKFSNASYSDFYFIEDYYSQSYGWYMFDEGKSIINELNEDLTNLIIENGYTNVTTFGSSKGGTAALLYGLLNPHIDNVFSLVPQIHVVDYINLRLAKYKKLFFPKQDEEIESYFDNIFFNENLYKNLSLKSTNIYFYTGVNDEQFDDLLTLNQKLDNRNCNNNIIINTSLKKHNGIVMENVPFVKSALEIITKKNFLKGPRLKRINSNTLLLKDK